MAWPESPKWQPKEDVISTKAGAQGGQESLCQIGKLIWVWRAFVSLGQSQCPCQENSDNKLVFIEPLLSSRNSSKCLQAWFHSTLAPILWVGTVPFYSWRNQGSKRWNNLTKFMQQVVAKTGFKLMSDLIPKYRHVLTEHTAPIILAGEDW